MINIIKIEMVEMAGKRAYIAGLMAAVVLMVPVITNIAVAADTACKTDQQVATLELLSCGDDGNFKFFSYRLTKEDLIKLQKLIEDIINSLSDSTDINSIIDEIKERLGDSDLGKLLEDNLKPPSSGGPVHKRVFIISNGYGKRFDLKLLPKIRIFKPYTFWNYYGLGNYMKKSKTIIIDPSPPGVRVLHGWQIGMMRRFVGIYIRLTGTMFDKDHVFFMGYAYKVVAFDIPDPTNFQ